MKLTTENPTWSLRGGNIEDVAGSYRTPLHEGQKITGLFSFYPEKVELYVDGINPA